MNRRQLFPTQYSYTNVLGNTEGTALLSKPPTGRRNIVPSLRKHSHASRTVPPTYNTGALCPACHWRSSASTNRVAYWARNSGFSRSRRAISFWLMSALDRTAL